MAIDTSNSIRTDRRINRTLDQLTAYASLRAASGLEIFSGVEITRELARELSADPRDALRAVSWLERQGFRVDRIDRLTVRFQGPAELFRQRFGLRFKETDQGQTLARSIGPTWEPTPDSVENLLHFGEESIPGIVFPEPAILHQVQALPPPLGYHHLRVPDDVASLMRATTVHHDGVRGQGVRAGMIDSGFHWTHPYFQGKGYQLSVSLPADPLDPDADASGHGTGESANLLAVAPEVELHGLAMDDLVLAISHARDELALRVLSNSWGTALVTDGPGSFWTPFWQLVQAQLALCSAQGMIILFSGGNGSSRRSFTASMPETISVGGAYIDPHGQLLASDYASSFVSTRFPGESVPEVCGLTGLTPRAVYIALPVPAGSEIDVDLSLGPFPDGDETLPNDGWGVFSGTSAACPMVAGVVGLILSKFPGAGIDEIRDRLHRAQDVVQGQSAMGDLATPGVDLATGWGLVDATAACS